MKKFVNATPHPINIVDPVTKEIIKTFPKTEYYCHVVTKITPIESDSEIPLFKTEYFGLEGLPEPNDDTIYIVSLPCIGKGRTDVVSPKGLVRDENGNPIGCEGLTY